MTETKKMISIRVAPELLQLLDSVAKVNGLYFDRSKTWLIENAIKQQYQPIVDTAQANRI